MTEEKSESASVNSPQKYDEKGKKAQNEESMELSLQDLVTQGETADQEDGDSRDSPTNRDGEMKLDQQMEENLTFTDDSRKDEMKTESVLVEEKSKSASVNGPQTDNDKGKEAQNEESMELNAQDLSIQVKPADQDVGEARSPLTDTEEVQNLTQQMDGNLTFTGD